MIIYKILITVLFAEFRTWSNVDEKTPILLSIQCFQCQGVMALIELPWIDFIAFTKPDLIINRIVTDDDCGINQNMLCNLRSIITFIKFKNIIWHCYYHHHYLFTYTYTSHITITIT